MSWLDKLLGRNKEAEPRVIVGRPYDYDYSKDGFQVGHFDHFDRELPPIEERPRIIELPSRDRGPVWLTCDKCGLSYHYTEKHVC